jgi:hypothetical protein
MRAHRILFACACLTALAACRDEPAVVEDAVGLTTSPQTLAEMEARIAREGEAAADELVLLVVASPVDLPRGELDRLGRLLMERSDRERLLEHLRAQSVARPESAQLEAWLERLQEYERSIRRGVDVDVGY